MGAERQTYKHTLFGKQFQEIRCTLKAGCGHVPDLKISKGEWGSLGW